MPQFGATDVVITDDPTDAVSAIREATDGRGVDYVFDAVGLAAIESVLLDCLAPAGTAVLVGIPRPEPPSRWMRPSSSGGRRC